MSCAEIGYTTQTTTQTPATPAETRETQLFGGTSAARAETTAQPFLTPAAATTQMNGQAFVPAIPTPALALPETLPAAGTRTPASGTMAAMSTATARTWTATQ